MPASRFLLAISDDLTGAVACGAELRRAGISVRVCPWDGPVPHAPWQALVVDTGSRLLSAAQARARVQHAVSQLRPAARGDLGAWYKRVDSGLRGNVAVELQALWEELQQPLLIAAAAPAYGVTTREGTQLLEGDAITRSIYGEDLSPAPSARLAEWLPGECAELRLDLVRGRDLEVHLAVALRKHSYVVLDAESAADLAAIAHAAAGLRRSVAFTLVGSYGLAGAWAAAQDAPGEARMPGILVVVGSTKPATRRQVELFSTLGACIHAAGARGSGAEPLVETAVRELEAGHDVVLSTVEPGGAVSGFDPDVGRALGRTAADALGRCRPLGLVLIGGELAWEVVARCGAAPIEVEAEPWPATPLVRFGSGRLRGVPGIIKSGVRGDEHWLSYAAGLLRSWPARVER